MSTRTFGAKRGKTPVKCNLTFDARRRGGIESARRKRVRAMAKLAGLSPVAVFRMGFQAGWKQGVRTERRRTGRAA